MRVRSLNLARVFLVLRKREADLRSLEACREKQRAAIDA
jgi:hypothetical protein